MNKLKEKIKPAECGDLLRSRELHRGKTYLAKFSLTAAAAFLAGFGKMIGFPSYMSVAVAAVSGQFAGAALLGTAVSAAVQGSLAAQAVQLGAIFIFAAMSVFFPHWSRNGDPVRLSLTTAAVCLLLSVMMSAADSASFTVSMRMISSLMCACIVYAAAYVGQRSASGQPIRVQGLTAVYLSMIYIVTVCTLCSVRIGPFTAGRVLACAVIPAAAKKRRAAGGAVMGALTAVSVTMCSATLAVNTMLLAAAGLISSAFGGLGRLASGIAFMVSASAALGTAGLNADTFNMLADIIAGTAIFAAMPSRLSSRIASKFMIFGSAADSAGQTASSRLTFAAMTISDIRQKLALVSETVESRAETPTLADRVTDSLCAGCRLYDDCRKNGTALRLSRSIDRCADAPSAAGCIRAGRLSETVADCRREQLADRAEAMRMKEMRLMLREQLGAMSDILNDLSCRLSRRRETDAKLSAAARSYFERQGFRGVRACVYTDESGSRHAEVYLTGEFEGEALSVTAGLCRTLECDLELPEVTSASSITKLEFDEIPPFAADFGSYSALGSESSCSGDTVMTTGASAGERYVLLSDGMGTGKRARLDSELTVNLAERLLRSGLTMATAQKVIGSVMQVKEWDESFATLDFLRLDLFSGRAEFLKSGAAPAWLCRDGSAVKIGCTSFPTGILHGCDPDVYSCKLFDGDLLLLASDGASEQALGETAALAYEFPSLTAEELALRAGCACTKMAEGRSDDITVAAVKISLRQGSRMRAFT
ncbi:stage II sporulation protein E [Ruminococcus sp. YE71]|uniref:SpoIIE family protein phosphatase n=1 Tax=unclassified Ruminococcus TaxID=2608920 RepID=UPI00087FD6DC|nr:MULTISPECIES: SpoIIE family protein phosphatase [unclassified Ruminococcus]SDA27216.1 stage II sporulation protein E [Ruminococcus sp. YE78]SFW45388.1 stage II sporulation protein E [Ruminococcus sp. YE71]